MRARTGSPSTFAQTPRRRRMLSQSARSPAKSLAPAAVVLAPVDERRVDAERDVVQEAPLARAADVDAPLLALEGLERRERVVEVEAEVAGEVVARAVRDDDERQVALDRDRGHARDRPVAARRAEHVRVRRARQLDDVVVLAEHARLDPARPRRGGQLVGRRALGPGARIDQQEPGHRPHAIGHAARQVRPNGSLRPSALVPIIEPMEDRGLHRIEDELGERWLTGWLEEGIAEIEAYLAKHAAFLTFLDTAEQH